MEPAHCRKRTFAKPNLPSEVCEPPLRLRTIEWRLRTPRTKLTNHDWSLRTQSGWPNQSRTQGRRHELPRMDLYHPRNNTDPFCLALNYGQTRWCFVMTWCVRCVGVPCNWKQKILAMGQFQRLTGPWWENFVSSKPSVLKLSLVPGTCC